MLETLQVSGAVSEALLPVAIRLMGVLRGISVFNFYSVAWPQHWPIN